MKRKILAVGEVLWDLLPAGRQLGGAPANFAYHCRALGAEASLVSRVGGDALGREILDRLCAMGISTQCVTVDPVAPTSTVSVELSADGQPHFTIHENVAWDRLEDDDNALSLARQADCVCFGSLAQRSEASRQTIRALVAATPRDSLRIFDINLRQHFFSEDVVEQSLRLSNILKINDQELPRLAGMLGLRGSVPEQLAELSRRYQLRMVALTRGSSGSLLYAQGRIADHPGLPSKVADTVGAGDAFTAAMALGLLAGWELDTVNERANELAAYVCSQPGGTPALPQLIGKHWAA